tara:strand:+ start:2780 stop:3505 length:726 start_codon:yes stop_codon:yes gene_type:complete
MNHTKEEWMKLLGIEKSEIPDILIMEGTWWEKTAYKNRLTELENPRKLNFPNMYLGRTNGRNVLFCCAYGAPRAVEPVHICGILGTRRVVQIGSCGSLQIKIRTGDIVIPNPAQIGEGASQYYEGHIKSYPNKSLASEAFKILNSYDLSVHQGLHLTTSALFQQNFDTITKWSETGYLSVDMETSAVFSAAKYFNMEAISLVFVWDELLNERTWLDTFLPEETQKQKNANKLTFKTALALA